MGTAVASVRVYAVRGESRERFTKHLYTVATMMPTIVKENGADLVRLVHTARREQAQMIIEGDEETTTGVTRLLRMPDDNVLSYRVIAVNNAAINHLFDNRYGTG
ncbi:MAG: hypothetical protein JXR76_05725 [Deltaproteobacteria bacterium]|nr:hypothetical protein [Deltaproteobacteria bacterium]